MEAPSSDATAPATPPPAAPVTSPKATPKARAPAHFEDADGLFKTVCRAFMAKRCAKTECAHVHDPQLCLFFWKTGACKFGAECKRNHFVTIGTKAETNGDDNADAKEAPKTTKKKEKKPKAKKTAAEKTENAATAAVVDDSGAQKEEKKNDKKPKKNDKKPKEANSAKPRIRTIKGKNTECFEPMTTPVDVRITYDLGSATDRFSTSLTSRDILLVPNLFSDFKKGELYDKLLQELKQCGIPEERLLKMWHGNDKLDGTHLIADDKTRWKTTCPTFQLVIDRLHHFFQLQVQATRFNWYKDTSQWKPFHFDAAAVKPEIAAKQNFTVGVSFGATRDAAFEHAQTRTVVSIPQPDSCVYAFARDTNMIWRHGILQDVPVRQEGRISVIAWGWIDGMVDPLDTVVATTQ